MRSNDWSGCSERKILSAMSDAEGVRELTTRDELKRFVMNTVPFIQSMKKQTPVEYIAEAIAGAPPEMQQALREAAKAERMTPQLMAVLAMKSAETPCVSPQAAHDPHLVAKLDEVGTQVRDLGGKLAAKTSGDGGEKFARETLEEVRAVRGDLRGVEDGLAALRPYHRGKVLVALSLVFALGAVAGWYGRIEYTAKEVRHVRYAD
jgi:hypothetical protein